MPYDAKYGEHLKTSRQKGETVIKGRAGWVGDEVRICTLDADASVQTVATVRLDHGVVACDHSRYFAEWKAEGIKGRPAIPRRFPKDGQSFLDELPYAYRYTYLWAEPAHEERP